MAVKNHRTQRKTRRRTRDLDEIKADLTDPAHLERYKRTKTAEDLPALGKHFCVECSKWFESQANKIAHERRKPHKKRVRQLREKPFTQAEAEAAVGIRKENVSTQQLQKTADDIPEEDMIMS